MQACEASPAQLGDRVGRRFCIAQRYAAQRRQVLVGEAHRAHSVAARARYLDGPLWARWRVRQQRAGVAYGGPGADGQADRLAEHS
jgi:hypothetical protein